MASPVQAWSAGLRADASRDARSLAVFAVGGCVRCGADVDQVEQRRPHAVRLGMRFSNRQFSTEQLNLRERDLKAFASFGLLALGGE
jgi:hypothetical protein